ncbi:MAG: riboflavin kinase [Candidatus Peribacteraceae bacterium]|nr:riboflavin kinase [Candidatus Peribacteraceae bacterium]MDD5074627.1 riboflavin kinase [Candidatus Peribacteraceae bacterium]
MHPALSFSARVIAGAGRGRVIGSPTLNLEVRKVPKDLRHGIYACCATWNKQPRDAVMHFGPRPVFHAGIACEVHVLENFRITPKTVTVHVRKRLRSVKKFPSVEALKRQIAKDIARARAMLADR